MENEKSKVDNILTKEEILAGDWGEDLSYIDEDLKIPTRSEVMKSSGHKERNLSFFKSGRTYPSKPIEEIEDYPSEILSAITDAKYKAETKGIYSLTREEKDLYTLWLLNHINRLNEKGKEVEPMHKYIVYLIMCNNYLFTLNHTIYIYDNESGYYVPDQKGVKIQSLIREYLDDQFDKAFIVKQIYDLIFMEPTLAIDADQVNNRPVTWIHFNDGYFDIKTGERYPSDPKYHEIGAISHAYEPSRYPEDHKIREAGKGISRRTVEDQIFFNAWLDQAIPDPEDQEMLMQYIGYSMTLDTSAQKFLLIVGRGGTGKSTLLKLVEEIIGKENISSVSLQGLQERFTPATLFLKQANICADIPLTALNEVDVLKKLTGEDLIMGERKGMDAFFFRSRARLFFSANDIPYIAEKSNAFYRRMLIIKMDQQPETIDPDLYEKLRADIPHIITRAVNAIRSSGGEVVPSDNCKSYVQTARKDSDTVEAFIIDRCEAGEKYRVDCAELYRVYKNYCTLEERQPVTNRTFYKELTKKGYEKKRSSRNYDIVGLQLSKILPLPASEAI